MTSIGELLFPRACAGCRAPGEILCGACRAHLRSAPHRVARPRELGMPVWAMGAYSDVRRNIIIAMKERGNQTVRPYMGAVFAAGLEHLMARGDIPHNLIVIPAPTRIRSARLRGGDPVLAMARAAAEKLPGVTVSPCLYSDRVAADQSDLSAGGRQFNMLNAVKIRPGTDLTGRAVILLDDVVTTGATLSAAAKKVQLAGGKVAGGLVIADA